MRIQFLQDWIDRLRGKVYKHPSLPLFINKKIAYESQDPTAIHTLIIGSSITAYGYRAGEGEFNLSTTSQDLFASCQMYQKYNTEHVHTILLSFSVPTPGFSAIKSGDAIFSAFLKLVFGFSYQSEDIAKQKQLCRFEQNYREYYQKYLLHAIPDRSTHRGNMEEYPSPSFDLKALPDRVFKHLRHNRREPDQMTYCYQLLEETARNKQQIYFIIPPFTDEYKALLPSSDILFEKLYRICENYSHATILNYYHDPSFTQDDFWDENHLNLQGAEKLTALIRKARGQ